MSDLAILQADAAVSVTREIAAVPKVVGNIAHSMMFVRRSLAYLDKLLQNSEITPEAIEKYKISARNLAELKEGIDKASSLSLPYRIFASLLFRRHLKNIMDWVEDAYIGSQAMQEPRGDFGSLDDYMKQRA